MPGRGRGGGEHQHQHGEGEDEEPHAHAAGADRNAGRVMAISIHPYIRGVPHRIGYLEKLYQYIRQRSAVLMWKGEQILDWYLGKG